jgi:phosphocarrier protein
MAERTVKIASASGLHARPAAIFAEAAGEYEDLEITIEKAGDEPVDAASILALMGLGAGHGEEVTLRAEGEGADKALDELAALLSRDLDAE